MMTDKDLTDDVLDEIIASRMLAVFESESSLKSA